jgi:hypothetical protein
VSKLLLFLQNQTPECNREDQSLITSNRPQTNSTAQTTDPGKDETNLSLITDEDFILADILERSAIDEENPSIHFPFFNTNFV